MTACADLGRKDYASAKPFVEKDTKQGNVDAEHQSGTALSNAVHTICNPEPDRTESIDPDLLHETYYEDPPERNDQTSSAVVIMFSAPKEYKGTELVSIQFNKSNPKGGYLLQAPLSLRQDDDDMDAKVAWIHIAKIELALVEIQATYACPGYRYERYIINKKLVPEKYLKARP